MSKAERAEARFKEGVDARGVVLSFRSPLFVRRRLGCLADTGRDTLCPKAPATTGCRTSSMLQLLTTHNRLARASLLSILRWSSCRPCVLFSCMPTPVLACACTTDPDAGCIRPSSAGGNGRKRIMLGIACCMLTASSASLTLACDALDHLVRRGAYVRQCHPAAFSGTCSHLGSLMPVTYVLTPLHRCSLQCSSLAVLPCSRHGRCGDAR